MSCWATRLEDATRSFGVTNRVGLQEIDVRRRRVDSVRLVGYSSITELWN
jgi:hypothetical protein